MTEEQVLQRLRSSKISSVQLDPYSYCNNACWYCPRAYIPNPQPYCRHMSPVLLDRILGQICGAKGKLVSEGLWHIWTGHYNEILLYQYFTVLLTLLKKHCLCTTILSNGTTLSANNIPQLVWGVKDKMIIGFCFNIPSVIPDDHARYTGRDPSVCARMVTNLRDLINKVKDHMDVSKALSIVVNGVADNHHDLLGRRAPKIKVGEHDRQFDAIREKFPDINVYKFGWLFDRAGWLSKFGIIHNWPPARLDQTVVDCNNGPSRPFTWAHINSLGELFLCCCDYCFDFTFGSLATHDLADVWFSTDHARMIVRALGGFCRNCVSSVREPE